MSVSAYLLLLLSYLHPCPVAECCSYESGPPECREAPDTTVVCSDGDSECTFTGWPSCWQSSPDTHPELWRCCYV